MVLTCKNDHGSRQMRVAKGAAPTEKTQSVTGSPTGEVLGLDVTSTSIHRPLLPMTKAKSESNLKPIHRVAGVRGLTGLQRRRGQCRISQCRLSKCTLRSHWMYASTQTQTTSTKALSDCPDVSSDHQVQMLRHHSEGLKGYPTPPQYLHGLPALPLNGLDGPVYRKLFHYYFSHQWERVNRILRPPPLSQSERQAASKCKATALSVALSDPAYCLSTIAVAHQQLTWPIDSKFPDKTTVVLHQKMTSLLRLKLADFKQADIAEVLLVIFTLVAFEILAGRGHELHVHRRAARHLVDSQGGVHNMGRAIQHVFVLDRIFSIFSNSHLEYVSRKNQAIRRPPRHPQIYGRYFTDPTVISDTAVANYCCDVCRAIEIMEKERWTFDPQQAIPDDKNPPDLHYFYFLKGSVAEDFANLNADMADRRDIPRCVLLATKIVDYRILQDNFYVTIPVHLANTIHDIIETQDITVSWINHISVLIWILFVLITSTSSQWQGRHWALEMLKRQLETRYFDEEQPWPTDWEERELTHLRTFVWSDTRLSADFHRTCREIVEMREK